MNNRNQVVIDQKLQDKATEICKSIDIRRPGAASLGQLRQIVDARVNKQESQGLNLRPDYSAPNALTKAFLQLQSVKSRNKEPALQCCTPTSIIQSLMDMIVQGLSPAKDQCYFIVYGNELQMRRSYFGTVASLLRLDNIKDVDAQVIYEGDEVTTQIDKHGHLVLDTEKTHLDWKNQDNEIVGAYAIITTADDVDHLTIMTMKQIKVSWSQSQTHKVQDKFASEMAKRTVLNRAAKLYVNTSDDSDLLIGAINDTTSNEYEDDRRDVTPTDDVERKPQMSAAEILATYPEDEQKENTEKSHEVVKEGAETSANTNDTQQEELFANGTIEPAVADK